MASHLRVKLPNPACPPRLLHDLLCHPLPPALPGLQLIPYHSSIPSVYSPADTSGRPTPGLHSYFAWAECCPVSYRMAGWLPPSLVSTQIHHFTRESLPTPYQKSMMLPPITSSFPCFLFLQRTRHDLSPHWQGNSVR